MSSELFSKAELKRRAEAAGAVACGVAACAPVDGEARDRFDRWIGDGCHAGMEYMTRYPALRFDPDGLLPGARSIISFAFPYFHPDAPGDSDAVFARYSLGDDYHDIIRARLADIALWLHETLGAATRVCVDTAPLLERYWAVRSGIGFRGLNGLLIVPGVGSYVLLGEILVTVELPPDSPSTRSCGSCRRCVESCPGHAIRPDGTVDSDRCRSYLTIECRDLELPDDVELGRRIYGCDICQEVCPWNASPAITSIREFFPRPEILALTRRDILDMDQERFSLIFRKSAIKRAKLAGLRRNVAHIRQV